ncbi:nucleotidyltransferase family protein [Pseudomonas fluorescens]|uniref:nucleotidyltransferase family protein n=1 Tax=Pseudomonas fluorescens TaxID=294 RepID=UPI0017820457|nr:nucleotidyltransferase family protein [Pseudomonas fluorescens]MBD8099211.1 nucleotidyltransferase family protein [Pseudomonas fluorescens]MBD8774130.1 nucleotidyltransferase family protein [Pseudomonas fluorescens]MBD8780840.1 nucleotidyltransferase family protein [Pseudomonas fluorescens]MBD8796717.1 nucleotidyltransferase family protein [Pseudomonas fluorescens]
MEHLIEVVKCYMGVSSPARIDIDGLLPTIFEHSIRNKLLPVVDSVLTDSALEFPARLAEAMHVLVAHEHRRTQEHLHEAQRLGDLLERAGIAYAIRKGPALANLYKKPFHRPYEDIDLLVAHESAKAIQAVLAEDGYLPGAYSRHTETVKPLGRAAQLQYRLSPDHLPHLHKLAPHTSLKAFMVDVAFTSGWHGDAFDCVTQAELDRAVRADGFNRLNEPDGFINLALHLYRESYLPGTVLRSAPSLRSYVDVFLYFNAMQAPEALWSSVHNEALRRVLRQVIEVVGVVFGVDLLNSPRVFSDEKLLYSMNRDGVDVPLGLSLVERMAMLSHREYATWIAGPSGLIK